MSGIVRKVDDLGRIVVPKEFRDILHIGTGDNISIDVYSNSIVIKKYSMLYGIDNFIKPLIGSLSNYLGYEVFISNLDRVLYSTNDDIVNYKISFAFKNILDSKKNISINEINTSLFEDNAVKSFSLIVPILLFKQPIGFFVIYDLDELIAEDCLKIVNLFVDFIQKYVENSN